MIRSHPRVRGWPPQPISQPSRTRSPSGCLAASRKQSRAFLMDPPVDPFSVSGKSAGWLNALALFYFLVEFCINPWSSMGYWGCEDPQKGCWHETVIKRLLAIMAMFGRLTLWLGMGNVHKTCHLGGVYTSPWGRACGAGILRHQGQTEWLPPRCVAYIHSVGMPVASSGGSNPHCGVVLDCFVSGAAPQALWRPAKIKSTITSQANHWKSWLALSAIPCDLQSNVMAGMRDKVKTMTEETPPAEKEGIVRHAVLRSWPTKVQRQTNKSSIYISSDSESVESTRQFS